MHTRRLVKRSILGSRVYAPSPTEDGAPVTGVVQAVKQENRDASSAGGRRSVYTVLLQDGSLKEFAEEEIAAGWNHSAAKGALKSSLKVCMCAERPSRQPARHSACLVRCFAAFNRFLHRANVTVSPPPRPLLIDLFQKTKKNAWRIAAWTHNCRLFCVKIADCHDV